MGVADWIASLPFVYVLAISVGLYALKEFLVRNKHLPRKAAHAVLQIVDPLLFAWTMVFVIITPALGQQFYIPSQSMEPTLAGHAKGEPTGLAYPEFYNDTVHDRITVVRPPFWFHGPHRGDILVFRVPPNANQQGEEQDYIKRLIGLPGEKLEVRAGKVWINDKALDEPYTMALSRNDFGPIRIPKDHYFMMGDNRNNSADSRYWGPLDKDRIVGKAWFRWFPLNKFQFLNAPAYPGIPEQPQPALGWPFIIRRYGL